jgi:hypothetical protein
MMVGYDIYDYDRFTMEHFIARDCKFGIVHLSSNCYLTILMKYFLNVIKF